METIETSYDEKTETVTYNMSNDEQSDARNMSNVVSDNQPNVPVMSAQQYQVPRCNNDLHTRDTETRTIDNTEYGHTYEINAKGLEYVIPKISTENKRKYQPIWVSSSQSQNLPVRKTVRLVKAQAVQSSKNSGYRHKSRIEPVNKETAIHLRRPDNTVNEQKSTIIRVPRPAKRTKDIQTNVSKNKIFRSESEMKSDNLKIVCNSVTQQRVDTKYAVVQCDEAQTINLKANENTRKPDNYFGEPSVPIVGGNGNHSEMSQLMALLGGDNNVSSTVKEIKSSSCFTEKCKVTTDFTNTLEKSNPLDTNKPNSITSVITTASASKVHTMEAKRNEQPKYVPSKIQQTAIQKRYSHDSKNTNQSAKMKNVSPKSCGIRNDNASKLDIKYQNHSSAFTMASQQFNALDNVKQPTKGNKINNSSVENMFDNRDNVAGSSTTNPADKRDTVPSQTQKKQKKPKKKIVNQPNNQIVPSVVSNNNEVSTKKKKLRKVNPSELNKTGMSCPKPSTTSYDLESRYQIAIDNTIYTEDSDIINKVESDKLSSVMDHRLLTLSDDEKAFLRNKSYLKTDASTDVKIRFTPKSKKNKQPVIQSQPQVTAQVDSSVDSRPNINLKEQKVSNPVQECIPELPKQTEGVVNNLHQNESRNIKNERRVCPPSPVVHLKRIDDDLHLQSTPSTVVNQVACPENVNKVTPKEQNNIANNKKVYYVINKEELNRIKVHVPLNITTNMKTQRIVTMNSDNHLLTGQCPQVQNHINNNKSSKLSHSKPKSDENVKMALVKQTANTTKAESPTNGYGNHTAQRIVVARASGVQNKGESQFISANCATTTKSLTVKDLLELKRTATVTRPMTIVQSASLPNTAKIINIPMTSTTGKVHGKPTQVIRSKTSETKAQGNPHNSISPIHNLQGLKVCHYKTPNTKTTSPQNASTSRCSTGSLQYIENGIRVVNPSDLKPLSNFKFAAGNVYPSYITPTSTVVNSSVCVPSTSFENHAYKPMHFRIGETTMVVRNRPKGESSHRKTLPAPKPKHKIANDYKKSRRKSSKKRKLEQANQRCLQTKLKTLLLKSQDSLHRLVQTLDLVPVDILKQVLTEPTAEFETIVGQRAYERLNTSLTHDESPESVTKYPEKERSVNKLSTIANIMQIHKNELGECSYNKHQVLIKYRKYDLPAGNNTSQVEFPCRIKFDRDGNVQRISIETLQQCLYLINLIPIDMELIRDERVLYTTMVICPPHVDILPSCSLSIAVGEIFPSLQNDRLKLRTPDVSNTQYELGQFLKPSAMDNVADFMDRRYCSETDHSLSPRVFSPMFYTKSMVDKFDHYGNIVNSESSSEDLTTDYNKSKVDSNMVRFSERAMALKVKQNELFESCRKLKSHGNSRMEPKRKRRRVTKVIEETAQNSDNIVKEILTYSEAIHDHANCPDDDSYENDDERQDVDVV